MLHGHPCRPQEDTLLRQAVAECGANGGTKDWMKIAERVPNRSHKQCRESAQNDCKNHELAAALLVEGDLFERAMQQLDATGTLDSSFLPENSDRRTARREGAEGPEADEPDSGSPEMMKTPVRAFLPPPRPISTPAGTLSPSTNAPLSSAAATGPSTAPQGLATPAFPPLPPHILAKSRASAGSARGAVATRRGRGRGRPRGRPRRVAVGEGGHHPALAHEDPRADPAATAASAPPAGESDLPPVEPLSSGEDNDWAQPLEGGPKEPHGDESPFSDSTAASPDESASPATRRVRRRPRGASAAGSTSARGGSTGRGRGRPRRKRPHETQADEEDVGGGGGEPPSPAAAAAAGGSHPEGHPHHHGKPRLEPSDEFPLIAGAAAQPATATTARQPHPPPKSPLPPTAASSSSGNSLLHTPTRSAARGGQQSQTPDTVTPRPAQRTPLAEGGPTPLLPSSAVRETADASPPPSASPNAGFLSPNMSLVGMSPYGSPLSSFNHTPPSAPPAPMMSTGLTPPLPPHTHAHARPRRALFSTPHPDGSGVGLLGLDQADDDSILALSLMGTPESPSPQIGRLVSPSLFGDMTPSGRASTGVSAGEQGDLAALGSMLHPTPTQPTPTSGGAASGGAPTPSPMPPSTGFLAVAAGGALEPEDGGIPDHNPTSTPPVARAHPRPLRSSPGTDEARTGRPARRSLAGELGTSDSGGWQGGLIPYGPPPHEGSQAGQPAAGASPAANRQQHLELAERSDVGLALLAQVIEASPDLQPSHGPLLPLLSSSSSGRSSAPPTAEAPATPSKAGAPPAPRPTSLSGRSTPPSFFGGRPHPPPALSSSSVPSPSPLGRRSPMSPLPGMAAAWRHSPVAPQGRRSTTPLISTTPLAGPASTTTPTPPSGAPPTKGAEAPPPPPPSTPTSSTPVPVASPSLPHFHRYPPVAALSPTRRPAPSAATAGPSTSEAGASTPPITEQLPPMRETANLSPVPMSMPMAMATIEEMESRANPLSTSPTAELFFDSAALPRYSPPPLLGGEGGSATPTTQLGVSLPSGMSLSPFMGMGMGVGMGMGSVSLSPMLGNHLLSPSPATGMMGLDMPPHNNTSSIAPTPSPPPPPPSFSPVAGLSPSPSTGAGEDAQSSMHAL
ncbi:hypothetical protein PAPYR_2081 [Paratrimastix pyriformis]|uniref:Uncharacterized protein n=1 Tax=Paratrimastix pyriformis TaxID=342808 RepID=A0ABQ8UQR4_9EUKA|nr:hypothetical protein PAPYR_2081 [Paratrimastix pyriformis]